MLENNESESTWRKGGKRVRENVRETQESCFLPGHKNLSFPPWDLVPWIDLDGV